MQGIEHVEPALKNLIEELNPDIFIVDISLVKAKVTVLSILLDTDEGITIDECARISRALNHYLEEEDPFNFHFRLEVSSPGVGRPLKVRRQYHKNVGRKLKVTTLEGELLKGKLLATDDTGITLQPAPKKRPKGRPDRKGGNSKKNKAAARNAEESPTVAIPFELIKEAKVEISFD